MNCRDIDNLMADYLGGEMSEATLGAFREHLLACETCREQAQGLEETVLSLRELDTVSSEAASDRTRSLIVIRRRPVVLRIVATTLKAAAMIALGVGIGWRLSAPMPTEPAQPLPSGNVVATAGIHPKWVERARHAGIGGSSFVRNLAAVAGGR